MNALWIAAALLTAGFVGWPVTALVFRLARTIDDKADAAAGGLPGQRPMTPRPTSPWTVKPAGPGQAPDPARRAAATP